MLLPVERNLGGGRRDRVELASWELENKFRDTSKLREKVDLDSYLDNRKVNPTKLVVVGQFPRPGEDVPLGTPITLTFISKDSIRVADIAELSVDITEKYKDKFLKDVTDDIWLDSEMTAVLKDEKAYSDLDTSQKNVVKNYAEGNGILTTDAQPEALENAFESIQLIFSM